MNHNWNTYTEDDAAVPIPQDIHSPEEVDESDSDSDQDANVPSFTPRRKRRVKTPHKNRHQPGRRSKQPINYKRDVCFVQ